MKSFIQKNHRLLFYGGWILLSLLQAYFTELQDDEAYYWVYSKFLSWGYFDHPPMIALLIKMGTVLFSGALGVRLLPIILNTLTIYITEQLIDKKNYFLFYAICLSTAVLQLAGFWAVPDIPLIFFTALFFLCYKNYVNKPSWFNVVALAVSIACLFYSKYHGLLIIIFTLLSNIKLLKQYKAYVACLIAFILFLPHLWWQYQHNWISVRFQLFENNAHPYVINFTTDYLLGQLLIAGPISGVILLTGTFAYKAKNLSEKALKYNGIGILLFFLLSTFRGIVEANWTASSIIPMLVLTHNYLQEERHVKWKQWLYRLLPVNLVIIVLVRVIMIFDIIPAEAVVQRFHAWKGWPQQLKAKTRGLPVVFNNSYQRASKYWFYTGQTTYSLNSYQERRNNYNFWPVEDSLLGKDIYDLDVYNVSKFQDSVQARLWKVGFSFVPNFHSFAKVTIQPAYRKYSVWTNAPVLLDFTAFVPPYYKQYLQRHPELDEPMKIGIFNNESWLKDIETTFTLRQLAQNPHQQFTMNPQLPEGKYFFRFAIGSNIGFYTHNSDKIGLEIKK